MVRDVRFSIREKMYGNLDIEKSEEEQVCDCEGETVDCGLGDRGFDKA